MTHYVDRSRTSTDWKCARKRYLQYDMRCEGMKDTDPGGIVSPTLIMPLYIGGLGHDVLQDYAEGVKLDTALGPRIATFYDDMKASAYEDYFAHEQCYLVEGLLRGFIKHRWPRMMAGMKIHSVEMETTIEIAEGIELMVKPDLILADHLGDLHYREFKSTSKNDQQWVDSWRQAPQLHIYAEALRRCGVPVQTMVIEGMFKGWYNRKLKRPRQESPFCYGYARNGHWSYIWKNGWYKTPLWPASDTGISLQEWIDGMSKQQLGGQFITTPPILPNYELAEKWMRQRTLREEQILAAKGRLHLEEEREAILDEVFPQNLDHCEESWGDPCPYLKLCHGPQNVNPLTVGFQPRVSHHQPEIEGEEC